MNFAKLPDFAGEAIGDAGGACHCARRHAALRAVTMGKSISVLGASSHTKVAPRPAKTAGFALSNVSSSCREPALAARRTLQDRNETVVIILINTMSQSGVSEPAGSSARSLLRHSPSHVRRPILCASVTSLVTPPYKV